MWYVVAFLVGMIFCWIVAKMVDSTPDVPVNLYQEGDIVYLQGMRCKVTELRFWYSQDSHTYEWEYTLIRVLPLEEHRWFDTQILPIICGVRENLLQKEDRVYRQDTIEYTAEYQRYVRDNLSLLFPQHNHEWDDGDDYDENEIAQMENEIAQMPEPHDEEEGDDYDGNEDEARLLAQMLAPIDPCGYGPPKRLDIRDMIEKLETFDRGLSPITRTQLMEDDLS